MQLVIVESPTKAKTITRFLGKGFEIKASMGHVMDLPKSKLGVDVEHNFTPLYEMLSDKKAIVSELKSLAKKADNVILATDPDREGEAISAHIKELLGKGVKSSRIVFHEITKEAIEEAFKHPHEINEDLVNAQTARRVLDRLVGYKLSPILWQKVRRGLSAGRVQSVALRLIVEREKEREKFAKEPYFTIAVLLNKSVIASGTKQSQKDGIAASSDVYRSTRNDNEGTLFELIEINEKKIELQRSFQLYDGEYKVGSTTIATEKTADDILADIQGKAFVVVDVAQREMRRSPQPPYTTSTLQQDAARRLGIASRRTMSIAQKLYEEGYITYHRTDSVTIADSAQNAIVAYVKKEYGEKYLPEKPRVYTAKQKLAQEAHEAIRPTKFTTTGAAITQDLGYQYGKLYDLIWKRTVASQMSDAITESTVVLADVGTVIAPMSASGGSEAKQSQKDGIAASQAPRNDNHYRFKANGSVLVFEGFLKVNPQALSDNKLPQYVARDTLKAQEISKEFHETPPPPRYNEASIIKTLEEKGIGRPSTYASIISTIESRRYIEREENRFSPTPVGIAVSDFLVANFGDVDDIPFTAEMEDMLDDIAHGKKEWTSEMKKFYDPFEKQLEKVKGAARVKIEVEETNEKCPKCDSPLVIRMGKFGKFFSCSTFPTCDFAKPFVEETGILCPKCPTAGRENGKVIIKKTKRGKKFYGCSNYPNCDFASWKLEDIKA